MTNNIGSVGVGVETDFSRFERQLRRMLDLMERQMQLNVPVNPQTARATAQMAQWRRLNERIMDIKVEISKKSLAKISSSLASMTGINALTNSFQNFSDHIQGLFDNIIPLGLKIGRLGAYAGPAAVTVGELAVGLVDLSKAAGGGLLAMPGIFAAMAASMFTFTTAFKDAPAILGKSLTQYQNFRAAISKPFWEKAEAPLRRLLDDLFPSINAGFGKLGGAAGGFIAKLSSGFSKVLTPKVVESVFGNWAKGMDILAEKAAGPLASITTNLVSWGSTLIPRIANGIGDMAAKFDGWLQNAIKTGELDKMFDSFVEVLKGAVSILKDGWSILNSISTAAKNAGLNAFPLVSIMDGIAKAMAAPGFQKGLTNFFEGAKRGADGMKQAWEPLKGLIAGLEPIISKFIGDAGQKVGAFAGKLFTALSDPKFLANVSSMLDGFLKMWDNLSPAIEPFVGKLGEIAHFMGTLADTASGSLSTAIQVLAPIFGTVLAALEPLVKAMGDLFQSTLKNNEGSFQTIADGFTTLIQGVTAFVEALNTPVLRFILDLIIDFFATAIAGAANLVGGVLQIVAGLGKLLSGDWSGLEDIWNGLLKGLEGAFQLFITLFAPAKILKFLAPLGRGIMSALGPILPGIGRFFSTAFSGIGKFLMEALSNVPGLIGTFFGRIPGMVAGQAANIGKFLIDGLIKGAQAVIGGFISTVVQPIIDGVKNLFGIHSPSTVFMEIGQFLIEGLINGIQAVINGVVALFTPVIDGIRAGWQALVDGVIALFNGFVGFISAAWAGIQAVATTVWNAILAVAAAVWAGIQAAGQAAWNFIQSAFQVAQSIIQTGFQIIQSVAQAVWAAIQAAVQAAISVIQGIINGLTSFISGVFNGFISIAQGAWDGIVAGANGLVSGIMGAISGITGAVAGVFNGVRDTIMGIWNSIKLPDLLGGLHIPGFATGVNNFGGGLAVVGENGPELVKLPKGADVIPNGRTQQLMSQATTPTPEPAQAQGDGGGFTFAPTIYNPKQETTEQSLYKSAQNLAYLGLTG